MTQVRADPATVRRNPSAPHRPTRRRRLRSADRRIASVMALPSLVPFFIFSILPVGYVVYISFTRYNGFLDPVWVGIQNYQAVMTDGAWWQSVINSFILGAGQIVIEVPLALALAVLLNRRFFLGATFRTIYFLPHVLSIAVMGVVFYFLFRPVNGIINGLIGTNVDWLGHRWTAMLSLILVGVWASFGINTVLLLVGLQTIPRDVYESSSLDGASGWQQFRMITLPLLSPVLRIVMMLMIVFGMRSFDLVKTLTDGGPAGSTDVMFTYLFQYFFGTTRGVQFGYASALSVVASIITAIIAVVYLYVSRNRNEEGRNS